MLAQKTPQDQYVESVVTRHSPATISPGSLFELANVIRNWANQFLLEFKLSGSYAKGTAVSGSADVDLFVSLRNDVLSGSTPTLSDLFNSLNAWLKNAAYNTRLQNVSIGLQHSGINVDVVPAVKHQGITGDHSLYKRKTGSWTKTNVDVHISTVRMSGRTLDIKAAKIWKNLHGLDISSFYLELVVLEALKGRPLYAPAANFMHVMAFLETSFVDRSFLDPANTANYISDELSKTERGVIKRQASESKAKPNWGQIIW